ncbi:hypothetical protein CgunFtcFv8_027713 [Champsocephalus gunnari]|uniref:Uncharacterized protein n=1 Tax=Champsocephalus gunnari TaxID=52237 RepID=A0AAN8I0Q9_CHAGU|nr:hypothetical protein CgunFtcFv8_027713 [Champsocephalus gunnari]
MQQPLEKHQGYANTSSLFIIGGYLTQVSVFLFAQSRRISQKQIISDGCEDGTHFALSTGFFLSEFTLPWTSSRCCTDH